MNNFLPNCIYTLPLPKKTTYICICDNNYSSHPTQYVLVIHPIAMKFLCNVSRLQRDSYRTVNYEQFFKNEKSMINQIAKLLILIEENGTERRKKTKERIFLLISKSRLFWQTEGQRLDSIQFRWITSLAPRAHICFPPSRNILVNFIPFYSTHIYIYMRTYTKCTLVSNESSRL